MKKIKLIMLDMDGTLLTDDKRVTDNTKEILRQVKKEGVLLGVATGRAPFLIDRTLKQYQMDDVFDVAVGLNGVVIYDRKRNIVSHTHRLTSEMTRAIAKYTGNIETNLIGYTQSCLYAKYDDEQARRSSKRLQLPLEVHDFTKTEKKWDKLLVIRTHPFTKEEFAYLQAMDNDQYHGFETDKNCFEIVDVRVSKATGIQTLCEQLHLSIDEVLAFGDSGNDVEMLQMCGLGVCMGNGNEQAKQVADAVTLSNEEDGIVAYLKQNWELFV